MSDIILVEGLELTNKPLTNFEIIDAGKKLKIPRFRGVFVRDNLPYKPKKNECGILCQAKEPTGLHGIEKIAKTCILIAMEFITRPMPCSIRLISGLLCHLGLFKYFY